MILNVPTNSIQSKALSYSLETTTFLSSIDLVDVRVPSIKRHTEILFFLVLASDTGVFQVLKRMFVTNSAASLMNQADIDRQLPQSRFEGLEYRPPHSYFHAA